MIVRMSWLKYALKGISKYPEIFKALEEFEKTGKLPKFTYEFVESARNDFKS
ncbi:Uncharacterised protein [uncultured archaeon]|nr:Uncharacterised protein [uncultured archaeon]